MFPSGFSTPSESFQYNFCSYSTMTKNKGGNNDNWVSIQLLFLFNVGVITSKPLLLLFQYSFCSYSTFMMCITRFTAASFNTASVLIQRLSVPQRKGERNSFNTASVLIQHGMVLHSIHTDCVSIQLLFLFNGDASQRLDSCNRVSIQLLFLFNWSDNNGRLSKHLVSIQLLFLFNKVVFNMESRRVLFQYSFCSYSTVTECYKVLHRDRFQYSFCSYSTRSCLTWSQDESCFNTASVLIQRIIRKEP